MTNFNEIALYLDEDTNQKSLIQALRNASVDVLTTAEANRLSFSDEEQLLWAFERHRVIYTFNVEDFCRLHRVFLLENRDHAGIIVGCQQKYSIGQQVRGILTLKSLLSADEMINRLEYLGNYIRNNP